MAPDGPPPDAATVEALCTYVVARLAHTGVHGVSVTQWVAGDVSVLVYASDPTAARLHDLQRTLGEGPDLTARRRHAPVLVTDLCGDPVTGQWVTFAREAGQLGVQAVFAFPLQIGAVTLGSFTLHSRTPTSLIDTVISEALRVADLLALSLLVSDPCGDSPIPADFAHTDGSAAVTHQATGMVMVQLDGTLAEALVTMRAYAYTHDLTLTQVAQDVVRRRLTFTPTADPDIATTRPTGTPPPGPSGAHDEPDNEGTHDGR